MRGKRTRRHRIPKIRRGERFLGTGRVMEDAVSGFEVPYDETIVQRGRRVSRRWTDGSRDRPRSW